MSAIEKWLAWPLLGMIAMYRYLLSPLLGVHCRFSPSCSAYARDALRHHGAFRGSCLAARRIGRCHPWGGSGDDPVPVPRERQDTD
ncbi:MAG: membrane protein insertion efficiency factor YidD [Woeseia sp.]